MRKHPINPEVKMKFWAKPVLFLFIVVFVSGKTVSAQEQLVDVEKEVLAKSTENKKKLDLLEKATSKATGLWDKMADSVKTQTLAGTLKYDVDIGDNVTIGIKNKIEVEPAYIKDYYRRMDEYELPIDIKPGWTISGDLHAFIRLQMKSKMSVWRLYPSYGEALCPREIKRFGFRVCPIDFIPNYLPVTADHILATLKPGEMVRMQVPLNIQTGVGYSYPINDLLQTRASVAHVVAGGFTVYVFRGDNNSVRLRLVGGNDSYNNMHFDFGMRSNYFDNVVRKLIRAVGGFEIVKFDNNTNGEANIFLADYILDFNYKEVKDAYDELFGRAVKFTDSNINKMLIKMINPYAKSEDLRDLLVSNLLSIENLYKADLNKVDKRVARNFVGSNKTLTRYDRPFAFNIPLIFKSAWRSGRSETQLTRRNFVEINGKLEEKRDNYVFPSWNSSRKARSYLFDYREELFRSANAIFRADDAFNITGFSSIGFYYDSRDGKYRDNEHETFINHLQKILPEKVYEGVTKELAENGLLTFDGRIRKVRTSMHYFINEDGLKAAVQRFHVLKRSDAQIEILRLLAEHIRHNDSGLKPYSDYTEGPELKNRCLAAGIQGVGTTAPFKDKARPFCTVLDKIAAELAIIVDYESPSATRKLALDRLTDIDLFRKMGPGFLFTLLPDYDFKDVALFELRFYVPVLDQPVSITRGFAPERELYEEILDQQRMLVEEIPDLRLDSSIDTLTTRDTK